MNWRIEIQDNEHHVINENGDVAGIYRTRLPALLEINRLSFGKTNRQGPWAKAFNEIKMRAVKFRHQHKSLEGEDPLVHEHEFESVDHTHPGYGTGSAVANKKAPK